MPATMIASHTVVTARLIDAARSSRYGWQNLTTGYSSPTQI